MMNALKKANDQYFRESILNKYNIFNLMQNMAVTKASKIQNIKLNTNAYYVDSFIKKNNQYLDIDN